MENEGNILKNKINVTIMFCTLFILGIVSYFAQIQLILIFCVAVFLILFVYLNKIKILPAIIMFLAFIGGFYISDYKINDADDLFYLAPRNNISVEGQVISIPETTKTNRTKFYVKVNKININNKFSKDINAKTIVTLFEKKDVYSKIQIGDTLSLKGNLRKPQKASNPSEFNYAKYLQYENTFSMLFVDEKNFKLIKKPDTLGWKFLQQVNNQRNLIIKKHSLVLKSPYLELLGGVVFGDDAVNTPNDLKESFKISGLLHLLAASGLNVGLIFTIWFFVGKICRLNYRLNIIIGAFLILIYTCMTGFSPSILRATAMIEFVLLGKLIDRQADNLALISLVCFLMLIYNPAWLCSISFQLSFLVTTGLIMAMPLITEWSKNFNKFMQFLISSMCIPIIAQICVLPLQMYYFNTFSLYSVIANILVLPFVTIVSFTGFVSSILALLPFIPDKIITICDYILYPFLIITVKISDFISNLPHANFVTIQPEVFQILIYYLLILLIFTFIKLKLKNKISIIVLATVLLIFVGSFIRIPDDKLHLTFFAVKNADSCLVKTPNNHYFVIDTGKQSFNGSYSQGEGIIAKYLLSKRIKKIDFVVLSHLDNDHIGGTLGLLQKIHADKIYVNTDIPTSKTSKELFNYLKTNKIHYEIVKNDTVLFEEDNFKLHAYLNKSIDENENSIINLIEYKDFKALFMGDAGTNGYGILPPNVKIDVLKLGHHGAKDTINKNVLSKINPQTVIISTGVNPYGHPHYTIIDLLIDNHVNFYRTDEKNAIEILTDGTTKSDFCYSTKRQKFIPCKD